ncbi:DNA-binding transcriptional LysR family regulator [Nitrobacteraceae bacterium AZCC 1564]
MDDRRTDLNLLLALDALLSEQNVTRAAKRLNLSQPALSAQLARLRDLFGDQLFVPTSRGVLPTAAAEELREPVRRALEEARGVFGQGQGFDPATAEFTFTIASSDYMQVAVLLPFLTAISEAAPKVRVMAKLGNARTARVELERGDLDLAFLQTGSPDALGLHALPLLRENYVGIARRGSVPTGRMPMKRFVAARHIIVSPSGEGFFGPTDEALAAAGQTRTVSFAVSSFVTLIEAVAQSELIALAPERLARRYADRLDLFKAPLDVQGFGIAMVWHDRTKDHPAHRWLRDRLAAFCNVTPRARR